MKIGILTFHDAANYGAFLQTFALSETLKDGGLNEVTIINMPLKKKKSILGRLLSPIVNYTFKKGRKKFLKVGKKINIQFEMQPSSERFDLYVVGSDQVWNKNITKDSKFVYFFDFLSDDQKRISYAASLGNEKWAYNEEETLKIKSLLTKFDAISVREKTAANLLKSELDRDSTVVLDPTLLLDSYSKITGDFKPNSSLDFVCFKFVKGQDFFSFSKRLQKEHNLKVILLRSLNPFKGVSIIPFPSISKWIRTIGSGKYVLTDSFHGVCFSIINKKNFIVIPGEIDKFSRISDLLYDLGLEDRIYYSYDDILNTNEWKKEIDYDTVYQKLDELRAASKEYLKNNYFSS